MREQKSEGGTGRFDICRRRAAFAAISAAVLPASPTWLGTHMNATRIQYRRLCLRQSYEWWPVRSMVRLLNWIINNTLRNQEKTLWSSFVLINTTILDINKIFKSEWRLYNSELLKFWEWKTTHAPHMMCVALSDLLSLYCSMILQYNERRTAVQRKEIR